MKVLYVVYAYVNKLVYFHAVQVTKEDEKEYTTLDRIDIENYINHFPKDKLNIEFETGFVTDKLDKKVLKDQITRIYQNLKEKLINIGDESGIEENDIYYKAQLEKLEETLTVEECEKRGYYDYKKKKEEV